MSSDSEDERFGSGFLDSPEAAVESALASSAFGPLAQRVEGVAEQFVTDQNIEKKTHFKSWAEPNLYAKMSYLFAFVDAIGHMDDPIMVRDEDALEEEDALVPLRGPDGQIVRRGFAFPSFSQDLILQDLRYRDSFKEGTRKHLRDITKIFERGDGGRRGGLFRR